MLATYSASLLPILTSLSSAACGPWAIHFNYDCGNVQFYSIAFLYQRREFLYSRIVFGDYVLASFLHYSLEKPNFHWIYSFECLDGGACIC